MPRHHHHTSSTPLLVPSGSPTRTLPSASPLVHFHGLYLLDYLVTALLLLTSILLDTFGQPFERGFDIHDPRISYPHLQESITSLASWLIGVVGIVVLLAVVWLRRAVAREGEASDHWWRRDAMEVGAWVRNVVLWDVHHAMLGTVLGLSVTNLLVNGTKLMVGALRPDFLARCRPSEGMCLGDVGAVREGRMSFPSGHSGRVGAAGGFALWYLMAVTGAVAVDARRPAGRVWRLAVCLIPVFAILFMCIDRLQRNRHHVEDIVVGCLTGLAVSFLSYRYYYPPLTSTEVVGSNNIAGKPKSGPLHPNTSSGAETHDEESA
ncbi:phosphatidic acid phosphatase type 2/haloperoxidase [Fimicolochytrium jonesii]|uniref:phosphatidic acid phosphatase type 2/haloperoxidase n=1 Tax=Fimicolochytrium jonesii TaxID=1396493 RepID=UPI0022FE960E|nr:phosphatidic acid phosphatase type 2/haloperoxidase [Fimicolochytrium jonesii]KAI8822667.1 phosphatidic acid phosphatase type 2/haloperoxidase [Fimicolochytrium jonesii]